MVPITVDPPIAPAPSPPPRLLDRVRRGAFEFGHPDTTAGSFVEWSRQFILFHGKRHPRELAVTEVGQFLDHVARSADQPLRAVSHPWEGVAKHVHRKASTCQKWTSRYRREWERLYRHAPLRRFDETSNEAHSVLKGLLRAKDEKTRLKAVARCGSSAGPGHTVGKGR